MQIKIHKRNADGEMRLAVRTAVREIRIKESFARPRRELVELCFSGQNTSGIIEMPIREFESIAQGVRARAHLVKSVHVIKEESD